MKSQHSKNQQEMKQLQVFCQQQFYSNRSAKNKADNNMLMSSDSLSKIVEDELSKCRNQKQTKITQKVHNDSHIFYLKTASNTSFGKQVFSLNFESIPDKKNLSRIKIKSKKELQQSMNVKKSQSGSLSPMSSSMRYTQSSETTDFLVQRQNKKIELRDALQCNIRANVLSSAKDKCPSLLVKSPKQSFKKNGLIKKRNYFNVCELIENEQLKKNKNAVVMMKRNMNSAMKWIKQQSLEKVDNKSNKISTQIKQLQFNAIEISKKIVGKNVLHTDRSLFQRSNIFLRPNHSLRENMRLKDRISNSKQQSLNNNNSNSNHTPHFLSSQVKIWRSNSHHLPKKSKFFESGQQVTKGLSNKKYVRTERNDIQMDLNPWRQEDSFSIMNRSDSLYMCLKTQKMDPKRKDDENQFVNYSIRTSKRQKDNEINNIK